ncbi:hypothetical protein J4Q44_G00155210 [Coregonus suidteri]|uniref:Uncharacterized protein n=1 Tax=Coregonus suidteri TaxID=861788 RepID=A0AAN8R5H7_9TELE
MKKLLFTNAPDVTIACLIFAWKVTSSVFQCLRRLAGCEPFGSFSTSKQPYNVPQLLFNKIAVEEEIPYKEHSREGTPCVIWAFKLKRDTVRYLNDIQAHGCETGGLYPFKTYL